MKFEYIQNKEDVEKALNGLQKNEIVGLDLEFDNNSFSYGVNLCLVQISTTDGNIYLIDPISAGISSTLMDFFANQKIKKVIHSGSEDVFVIRTLGGEIKNLLDTEKLAKLAGEEKQGLSDLTQKYFNAGKMKDLQRSDWNQRPLSEELLKYAAADVDHILPLAGVLEDRVKHIGLGSWITPLMRTFEADFNSERAQKSLWVKGMNELSKEGKINGLVLLAVREKFAEKNNVPPYKVLRNHQVLYLSDRKFENFQSWKKHKGHNSTSGSKEFFEEYHKGLKDPSFRERAKKTLEEKKQRKFVKPHIFQKRVSFLERFKKQLVNEGGDQAARLVLSKAKINDIAVSGNLSRIDPFFLELCYGSLGIKDSDLEQIFQ